ncbi:hypothetical protein BDQ17DRAFT_373555 [Cyathus striatus]|nr:hypothetical protein BDQ17DRAFT_373555 [Cyathus striatus]
MDSAVTEGTDISSNFSPLYWGFVISLFLTGVSIIQAYIYFSAPRDRSIIQYMAAGMLALNVTDSMLVAYSIYFYLVPHFGATEPLGSVTPELSAECLIATVITSISQMYFVYQLVYAKRLGKGNWIVIGGTVSAVLSLIALAGGIACVVTMYLFSHGILEHRSNAFITFGVAKGFGTATDIAATIAMCLFLNSAKTGIRQTTSLLNSLMKFIINRGILVTVVQALLLITFYAVPVSNNAWLAFHVNIPKIYANTFFAMLNARDELREKHIAQSMRLTGSHISDGRSKRGILHAGEQSTLVGSELHFQPADKEAASQNMPMVTTTVVIETI